MGRVSKRKIYGGGKGEERRGWMMMDDNDNDNDNDNIDTDDHAFRDGMPQQWIFPSTV